MEKLAIIKSSIDDIAKNLDIVLNSPNDKVPLDASLETEILFVCFYCKGYELFIKTLNNADHFIKMNL